MKTSPLIDERRKHQESERLQRFAIESKQPHNLDVPKCPLILRIEVTNRCNANCVFCAYQYQERPFVTMTDEIFQTAVDQFTALGGNAINFSPVVGEALLDKELEKKVAYVRKFPQYTKLELFTNGILLTRQRFESLVSAGINQIHIALSGFSAAEYKQVYRNSNYPKLLQNLLDIAESPALKTISLCIHSRTASLMPELYPDYLKIKRLGVYHVVFEPHLMSWNAKIKQEDLPGHLFTMTPPREQRKPCFLMWGGLAVLADGRMTMCGCCDVNGTGLPLGNIQSVKLDAHLRDGRWLSMRNSFYEGDPPDLCKGCDAYWPHG